MAESKAPIRSHPPCQGNTAPRPGAGRQTPEETPSRISVGSDPPRPKSLLSILYIDAMVVKVGTNGTVINRPAYVVVGMDVDGRKHMLGIWLGEVGRRQTSGCQYSPRYMKTASSSTTTALACRTPEGPEGSRERGS